MKPLVYIETTIPSYYHSTRAELAADIARTREWWDQERGDYDCYVSAVVLDELAAGTSPNQADCLQLVQEFPLLEVTDEVLEIADVYHVQRVRSGWCVDYAALQSGLGVTGRGVVVGMVSNRWSEALRLSA